MKMSSLTRTLILIIIACLLAALALPPGPVEADAHILAHDLRISQVYRRRGKFGRNLYP
jgi:hypothetical protein